MRHGHVVLPHLLHNRAANSDLLRWDVDVIPRIVLARILEVRLDVCRRWRAPNGIKTIVERCHDRHSVQLGDHYSWYNEIHARHYSLAEAHKQGRAGDRSSGYWITFRSTDSWSDVSGQLPVRTPVSIVKRIIRVIRRSVLRNPVLFRDN